MIKTNMNNDQVIPEVARGGLAQNRGGSFSGHGKQLAPHTRVNRGHIPKKVAYALEIVARELGGLQGMVLSYDTPIAVKIAGVWIQPHVTYSTTTSSKHATHLYRLAPRAVPWDASPEDILDIIAGYIEFDRHKNIMRRGPVARLEGARK